METFERNSTMAVVIKFQFIVSGDEPTGYDFEVHLLNCMEL